MSAAGSSHPAFEALDAANRALADAVERGEPEALRRAIDDQVARFEAARVAIEAGAVPDAALRSRLLGGTRDTEDGARAKRDAVRAELGTLRGARSTANRIRGAGESARFLSRRV